jgi:transcriptional regulator with XRE-family HTH domain
MRENRAEAKETSMTNEQAKRIGRMIATARRNRGWSLRRFSVEVGISHSSLQKLERGEYTERPDWLIRIADTLGIDPERITRVAGPQIAANLPGMRTYFRAKYELSQDDIDVVERAVEDIQRKHKDTER